jgi:alpha-beta hydrolase superfamily lysophospholipase
MTITKKKLFRWTKVFILIYSIIGIAFYYLQDKVLFRPVPVEKNVKYDLGQPYAEVNLPYNKETNLNIIQFPSAGTDSAKGVVLYFHGNKDNVTHYASHAAEFTHQGYEIWMLDYPKFGKSTGKLTEQDLYAYALVVYRLARSRWTPNQIILYGKSLGTCIAAQLAAVRDCRRLILECPYYSITSMARRYFFLYPLGSLLHYKFPTYEYLPQVTAPITIFHGTDDGVVPYSNAARLKPLLRSGDEFITIDGGSHNNLQDYPMFREKLDSLLRK